MKITPKLYKTFFEYSYNSIDILDVNGKVVFQSSKYGKISGRHVDSVIGTTFTNIIHPEDKVIIQKIFNKVISIPNSKAHFECKIVNQDNKIKYVEGIFANHIDDENIQGILLISKDVTKKKNIEKTEQLFSKYQKFLASTALNFLELSDKTDIYSYIGKMLKQLVNNSLVFVHSYNKNNNRLKLEYSYGLNKKATQIIETHSIKPSNLSGEISSELYTIATSGTLTMLNAGIRSLKLPELSENIIYEIEENLNLQFVYIIGIRRKNNLYGMISLLATNYINENLYEVIETFISQASISLNRKHIEDELIIAKQKAEEADRLKSAFLANFSHEIRTPLNGIIGFSQLLANENISDEKRDNFIKIIESNSQLLTNLINDIIDISKIESGQLKLSYTEININSIIQEMKIWLDNEVKIRQNNRLKISAIIDNSLINENIVTDKTRLKQILINLLGNALKFTETGSIEFGCKPEIDISGINKVLFKFYVKDTGIGINKNEQKLIFERFRQADNSSTREYGGTGLGLAITKNLVEMMGGKIWLHSVPDEGTIFFFTLPYRKINKQKRREKKKNQKLNSPYLKTILVVDRDKTNIMLIEEILSELNVKIINVQDDYLALNIIKTNYNIDLIISELNFNSSNGYSFIEKIKVINKKLPIIILTASVFQNSKEKAFKAGCSEFIHKPIQKDNLIKIVNSYINKN